MLNTGNERLNAFFSKMRYLMLIWDHTTLYYLNDYPHEIVDNGMLNVENNLMNYIINCKVMLNQQSRNQCVNTAF